MFSNEGQENSLYELVRHRRSIRRYTGERVPDDVVKEILKIALLAPSSWGRHPIEFVVLRDRATIEAVARCKRMGAGPPLRKHVKSCFIAQNRPFPPTNQRRRPKKPAHRLRGHTAVNVRFPFADSPA